MVRVSYMGMLPRPRLEVSQNSVIRTPLSRLVQLSVLTVDDINGRLMGHGNHVSLDN